MKNLVTSNHSRIQRVLLVAFITLMTNSVFAQRTEPSTTVKESFSRSFASATNVTWEKAGPLYMATFINHQDYSIAYLNNEGSVIASGRKIEFERLPLSVQKGLEPVRESFEQKFGSLKEGSIFEMIKDGNTEYYIPLENSNHAVALNASSKGEISVLKKTKGKGASIPVEVIAMH